MKITVPGGNNITQLCELIKRFMLKNKNGLCELNGSVI